jgi:hypothetical protein
MNRLQLNTKYWNSPFNAQGSGVIIVVAQVGPVKIYVAAVEALKKKERQDETQFTTKIDENVNQILACEPLYKVSTLANSSLIILFSEMFKFSNFIFF